MRHLLVIQWRDLMNQDPLPLTVFFKNIFCNVFVEYVSIKIVYFHLKYYRLFLYSKYSSSLTTVSKMFHMTAPFMKCVVWQGGKKITVIIYSDVTMGRWCGLFASKKKPQLGGDIAIETKQSCDQQLGSFTQDPEMPLLLCRTDMWI